MFGIVFMEDGGAVNGQTDISYVLITFLMFIAQMLYQWKM